jgi:hypothetical protein
MLRVRHTFALFLAHKIENRIVERIESVWTQNAADRCAKRKAPSLSNH